MWSIKFTECTACGTTKRPHMAKGMCNSCYLKKYRNNPKNAETIKQQKHEWYNLNKDLSAKKKEREKNNYDSKRAPALERDNHTCQDCGNTDREQLVVHHKDYSGRGKKIHNNNMDNLITLCRACHVNTHRDDYLNKRKRYLETHWSYHYNSCTKCGTTEKPHAGKGLCKNCYDGYYRENKPRDLFISRKHSCCVECGTTKRQHIGRGLCVNCTNRRYYHRKKSEDMV